MVNKEIRTYHPVFVFIARVVGTHVIDCVDPGEALYWLPRSQGHEGLRLPSFRDRLVYRVPQLNRVVAPVLVVKQHFEGENCVEEAHVAHVFLLGLFLPLDFVLKRLGCGYSVFDL